LCHAGACSYFCAGTAPVQSTHLEAAQRQLAHDLNYCVCPLRSAIHSDPPALPFHVPRTRLCMSIPSLPRPRMPRWGGLCRTPDVTSQAERVGAAVLERILAKWWSFTNHTYKNIIVLCMHVCLGAWWAHGSWRPGESRFGSGIFGRLIGHVSCMYFFDVG
jgi:hypothetical protein